MKKLATLLITSLLLCLPANAQNVPVRQEITKDEIKTLLNTHSEKLSVMGLHLSMTVKEAKAFLHRSSQLLAEPDEYNPERIYVYEKTAAGRRGKALLYLIWNGKAAMERITVFGDALPYLNSRFQRLLTLEAIDDKSQFTKEFIGRPDRSAVTLEVEAIGYTHITHYFDKIGLEVTQKIKHGKDAGVVFALVRSKSEPKHHAQKKHSVHTGDDPLGLKIWGMPKAKHKYLIAELPAGTKLPAEYSSCGDGVYYQKERVRGVDLTAVMVHFRAEGDFEFPDRPLDPLRPRLKLGFESYVPEGWVAFTFTMLKDSFTHQDVRAIRMFPRRPVPGTSLQRAVLIVDGEVARVDRSWVEKEPYVTWEILPESQLSHLIFRVRLPESAKKCLQSKK